ncbi:DnaD domain protein [Clostridium sp. PL3]|uniref:DnaD domain protein n=1 Tax=Clostridium thailandense TaxID=2794346 RepID=A0A949TY39_9CLOT|nr:DnaD domain protein [Clostridium thailandense]MBV7275711.1 DnaD domain protein [Clostridium thailandense]
MDNTLIKDENIMIFHPKLAELLGLNESIILNQIHYWINKKTNIIDGMSWVYNSYENWHKQLSFISTNTIKKAIKNLEDMEIILCANFNKCKMDKTKWYTINYDKLKAFLEKHKDTTDKDELSITINDAMEDKNMHCSGLNLAEDVNNSGQAIPETTTETTHNDDAIKENASTALESRKAQSSDVEKVLNILPESSSFKDIVEFYMKNISFPGGYELERLKYLLEEFKDPELIIFAIQQSLQNNARNLRYIEKVLYNWMDNGVKNKIDAEAFTESFRKYKEEKNYGRLTGDPRKNRGSHPKTATENKWTGYKPPEPKISTASYGQELI